MSKEPNIERTIQAFTAMFDKAVEDCSWKLPAGVQISPCVIKHRGQAKGLFRHIYFALWRRPLLRKLFNITLWEEYESISYLVSIFGDKGKHGMTVVLAHHQNPDYICGGREKAIIRYAHKAWLEKYGSLYT